MAGAADAQHHGGGAPAARFGSPAAHAPHGDAMRGSRIATAPVIGPRAGSRHGHPIGGWRKLNGRHATGRAPERHVGAVRAQRSRIAVHAAARPRFHHHVAVRPAPERRPRTGVGWSGSTFWPRAHQDIIAFAFQPSAFGNRFWASAYDEVIDDIFWPPSHGFADVTGTAATGPDGRGSRRASRPAAPSRELVQTCDAQATAAAEFPFERIEQSVGPAGTQRAALDALRTASADAGKELAAACPRDVPRTPVARLEVMENRLGAMLRAIEIVSPAIKSFYGALSDEQKARLNQTATPPIAGGQRLAARDDTVRVCGGEPVPKFAELTIHHLEQVVQPTAAQRGALDDLKGAAARATATLRAACPTNPTATPVARLEAMGQRVRAMLEAVQTVRPALSGFYGLLSDEQKARFNTMSARDTDLP
jgi:hypothetical protein